ncbi:MAG: iron ABC transporter permease [Deltaproteobacteria bacterium]|nr:iron ABC transporter permease [Deltaproteobacteria bacterium]
MIQNRPYILHRLLRVSVLFLGVLMVAVFLGISLGSTHIGFKDVFESLTGTADAGATIQTIIWQIRVPRVLVAALVGAALSVGGLVFQALLRNPLAEPYILGISSGSGIGAILGILAGLSRFPGVGITAFAGSVATLLLLLLMASGQGMVRRNTLLLSGVMINAFCGALIMFLISITHDARLHNIIFWLMGDLSTSSMKNVWVLGGILLPSCALIFLRSNAMNVLLMGKEVAHTMGIHIRWVTGELLVVTSLMVSITVSQCGPIGFVGLVIPHLMRLILGPDHRILVPSCILSGGTYMILCDVLARTLPDQGEMPAGVITAMIGAPLFIILLKRSGR